MPLWIYATVKLAFTAAHRQGLLDGIWTVVNYPYGNKYDDVKLPDKKPARFTLSIQEGQNFFTESFPFFFSVFIDKLRASITILSKSFVVLYTYAEFQK